MKKTVKSMNSEKWLDYSFAGTLMGLTLVLIYSLGKLVEIGFS